MKEDELLNIKIHNQGEDIETLASKSFRLKAMSEKFIPGHEFNSIQIPSLVNCSKKICLYWLLV